MSGGYDIAMAIDPNESDDVCTFCQHVKEVRDGKPICAKGHETYFRSLSSMGPIWVSDCESGELHPELLAVDTAKGRTPMSVERTENEQN